MWILDYEVEDKLHEQVSEHQAVYESVEQALDIIKKQVKDESKIKLSDYSRANWKQFRWLHVECKSQTDDHYYYKLNEMRKVELNPTLM